MEKPDFATIQNLYRDWFLRDSETACNKLEKLLPEHAFEKLTDSLDRNANRIEGPTFKSVFDSFGWESAKPPAPIEPDTKTEPTRAAAARPPDNDGDCEDDLLPF